MIDITSKIENDNEIGSRKLEAIRLKVGRRAKSKSKYLIITLELYSIDLQFHFIDKIALSIH